MGEFHPGQQGAGEDGFLHRAIRRNHRRKCKSGTSGREEEKEKEAKVWITSGPITVLRHNQLQYILASIISNYKH